MRLVTFSGWVGSGWPAWISDPQFEVTMNNMLGLANMSSVVVNLLPGLFIRWCDRKISRENVGVGVGLAICYFFCFLFFLLSGIFGAFQERIFGYLAILCFVIGKLRNIFKLFLPVKIFHFLLSEILQPEKVERQALSGRHFCTIFSRLHISALCLAR